MTNQIALSLVLLIAAVLAVDLLWLGGGLPLEAARGMDRLIEQVSFWR